VVTARSTLWRWSKSWTLSSVRRAHQFVTMLMYVIPSERRVTTPVLVLGKKRFLLYTCTAPALLLETDTGCDSNDGMFSNFANIFRRLYGKNAVA